MSIEDYSSFDHLSDGQSKPVYFRHPAGGPRAPVILMHELPGMGRRCVERGDDLWAAGFSVYLPLFFGQAGRRIPAIKMPLFCLRRELDCFGAGRTSPIADWIRSLCRAVSQRHEGARIGVIGMCLTGNFVLYAAMENCVQAPVMCQPSLPLLPFTRRRRADVKLSPEDLETVKKRVASESLPVLGFRFVTDKISPDERFQTLEFELGANFRPTRIPCAARAHATLTDEYGQAGTREAFRSIIEFMEQRL